MGFKIFKNTVLFFVLITMGCSKHLKNENTKNEYVATSPNTTPKLIVAANQTGAYLPILKEKRVGIVANQTSVIFKNNLQNSYTHIIDSLLKHNISIKKVFSPEHGFRGKADAGELVKDGVDTKTGLTIHSLHGKHKKPTKEKLEDIDVMIFDIQDVGVRFYTYISTLHYVMEACAEQNIPLLILDRPNPNGNYIDGPILEKEHHSFLGMHPVPLVHGMTIGEYAKMINGEAWLKGGITCNITIIELKNYSHNSFYELPIRPSPNLPNDQSIKLYPSLGLFEGTTINAGRGTEFQFQRYGSPNLDRNYYSFDYTPVANFGAKYPKHQNKVCYGVDLSTTKIERHFTLKYILDAYKHSVNKSKFFNTNNFTKHAGTKKLQQQIEAGQTEKEIKQSWIKGLTEYKKMRTKYLIYKD